MKQEREVTPVNLKNMLKQHLLWNAVCTPYVLKLINT